MSDENITPGNWKWYKDGDGNIIGLESDHKEENKFSPKGYVNPTVMSVETECVGYTGHKAYIEFENEQDAKIIENANKIYEMLKYICSWEDRIHPVDLPNSQCWYDAAELIDKIEG